MDRQQWFSNVNGVGLVATFWVGPTLLLARLHVDKGDGQPPMRVRATAAETFTAAARQPLQEGARAGEWGGDAWRRIERDGVGDPEVWMRHLQGLPSKVLGLVAVLVHGWVDSANHRYLADNVSTTDCGRACFSIHRRPTCWTWSASLSPLPALPSTCCLTDITWQPTVSPCLLFAESSPTSATFHWLPSA